MKEFLIVLSFLALPVMTLYSQEIDAKPSDNWKSYIHLESGFMYPSGTVKESIAIRQNISSYFVNQSSDGQIYSETSGFMLSASWEYFNKIYKSGISAGLRYTGFRSEISGFSSNNADFFYLRYSMLNSDTKFTRVKSITEANNFVSIPIELRVIPIQNRYFSLFAKGGAEFSMLNLNQKTHINFQNTDMNIYEDDILNNISSTTNKFYSTLYSSLGIIVGNERKVNYLFEIFLPSFFLTENNFSLVDLDHFQGFKFSLQFPLHN